MSERDLPLLLNDIRAAILAIFEYTTDYSFEQYEADSKTRHAVERNFEIIGEAVARIPDHYKTGHPDIEWRIIKDFRNFIIHDYFGINNRIVWNTIKGPLPVLLNSITILLKTE
jgi:uncharacterized protein with HEPN domain